VKTFKVNDYLVVKDNLKNLEENQILSPNVDNSVVGFAFYKKGDVTVNIKNGSKTLVSRKKSGTASSFYIDKEAKAYHHVLSQTELEKVTIFLGPEKLADFIEGQEVHFHKYFKKLLCPDSAFVQGTNFATCLTMDTALAKIFRENQYTGIVQSLFLESQINELMFSYFNAIDQSAKVLSKLCKSDIDKIYFVREMILKELDAPFTLFTLAREASLNEFKLKCGFKELFGMPVYQYILHKRLEWAYESINNEGASVQEAAFLVGYSSVGSFSNAFQKKFGYRPSSLRN